MGIGVAGGEKAVMEATKKAMESPLLETSIDKAKAVILNFTGSDIGMLDIQEAADTVHAAASEGANIIFGLVIKPDVEETSVTIIATGFGDAPARNAMREIKGNLTLEKEEKEVLQKEQTFTEDKEESEVKKDENSFDIPTFLQSK